MTPPSLLLAFVLSTLYGSVFHLWQGGGANRLMFYLVAGWVGFVIGHFVGAWFGVAIGAIGPLNVGSASAGSVLTLLLARWLIASDRFKNDDLE